MKSDILTNDDIVILIDAFYKQVKNDPLIGHFFTKVIKVDWDKHLPTMYNFWGNVVFHTSSYEGNPMVQHLNLHKLSPLKMEHFQHWIALFNNNVDEHFEGTNANYIKQRAISIATVMQIKIFS